MGQRGRPPHPDILTSRQWEVLELLRAGLTDPQIAEKLGISVDGAKYHVSEILSKLCVATRQDAAAWTPETRRWWTRVLKISLVAKFATLSTAALALTFVLALAYSTLVGNSTIEDSGGEAVAATATSTTPTQRPRLSSTPRPASPAATVANAVVFTQPTASAAPVPAIVATEPAATPVPTLPPEMPFSLTDEEILHYLTTIYLATYDFAQLKTNDHLNTGWLDVQAVYSCANDAEDGRQQVDAGMHRYPSNVASAQLSNETPLYYEYINAEEGSPAWPYRIYRCSFWRPSLDYNGDPINHQVSPRTLGWFNAELTAENLDAFARNEAVLEFKQLVNVNAYATPAGAAVSIYYPFQTGLEMYDCEIGLMRATFSIDQTTRLIVRTDDEVRRFPHDCVYIPGEYIDYYWPPSPTPTVSTSN